MFWLRLRCTTPSLDCLRAACESRISPDAKLILIVDVLHLLRGDSGLMVLPAPPDVRPREVKCSYGRGSVTVIVVGDDGVVYRLTCQGGGYETVCYPAHPAVREKGQGEEPGGALQEAERGQ